MSSIERIFRVHQRCKEITRLHARKGFVIRFLAGLWASFTGWRLFLRYKLFRPALPEALPGGDGFVVSLTSFPPRMKNLWMVIDMLMRSSVRPSEIVLCLYEGEFPGRVIPESLKPYLDLGLSIIWAPLNLKPHKKYYYTCLRERSGTRRPVVTVDDDIFYPPDFLARLSELYEASPDCVCANVTRIMGRNAGGKSLPSEWPFMLRPEKSQDLFPVGFGSVLYPPSVYDRDLFYRQDIILQVALNADDLWLKYCELEAGIEVVTGRFFVHPPTLPSSQKVSLASENVAKGRNDRIWAALNELPK